MKAVRFACRFIVFAAVFWALCTVAAFFCRDDVDTYTRAMMRELHSPQKFDALICGASHVSHGLYPAMMKEALGVDAICTGTPNQPVSGTLALLRDTLLLHPEVKKVFVECDFATANGDTPWMRRKPGKGFFLVYSYLKNPIVKIDYLMHGVAPAYYLNYLLPIGKESLLNLSPVRVCRIASAKMGGSYWNEDEKPCMKDAVYAGRGCVMGETRISGDHSSDLVAPINVKGIGQTWKDSMKKIVQLCNEKGVAISFFSNPSTDYYLTEKGNYDEYVSFLKEYIGSLGCEYCDFSLCKESVCTFYDKDFYDDNHLNKDGIKKFTSLFCSIMSMEKSDATDAGKTAMFYDTFSEKKSAQEPRVYGLMLDESKDKKSIAILPVMNRDAFDDVEFRVKAYAGEKEVMLETKPKEADARWSVVQYPQGTTGKIEIEYFLYGEKQGSVTEYYVSL